MRSNQFHQSTFLYYWQLRMGKVLLGFCLLFCLIPGWSKNVAADKTPQEQAQSLTALAVEKFNQGQFDMALEILNKSLKVNEPVYETHYWIGRVYATKAGSSAAVRQQAISHFRRALELQPYGEDGDLTRGWLAHFEGRPKQIGIFPVQHSTLQGFDSGATSSVVQMLAASAQSSQLSVAEVQGGAVDLDKTSSEQLARMCRNAQGIVETGWLVGIAVEKVDGARSNAKVWIFDPLGNQLYNPLSFSTSTSFEFFKIDIKKQKAPSSGNPTLDNLSSKIWVRCRPIVGIDSNVKLLDEIQFSSSMDGVYARSAAPYEQAITLPLIMLAPVATTIEDEEDTTRQIASDLQQALLEPRTLSAISAGNARKVLNAMNIESANASNQDWARVGQAVNCRYTIVPTLSRFELKAQNMVIATKVTVKIGLKIVVVDCMSGKEISSKTYEKSASSTKFLSDGLDSLLVKRTQILGELIQSAASEIGAMMVPPNTDLNLPVSTK